MEDDQNPDNVLPFPTASGEVLTNEEMQVIVRAALMAVGHSGQSHDEIDRVIEWATEARINSFFLNRILMGQAGAWVYPDGVVRVKNLDRSLGALSIRAAVLKYPVQN